MKWSAPFVLVGLLLSAASAELRVRQNDLVVISGDSITVQELYSVYVETYLLAARPAKGMRVMQFGSSGEITWGFLSRVNDEIVPFLPDVVLTCYGMNDGGYVEVGPAIVKSFGDGTRTYLKALKHAKIRTIVMGSPTAVDTHTYGPDAEMYNKTLKALRDVGEKVAKEEGVPFADMHTPLLEVMKKMKAKYGEEYNFIGQDGFHPGPGAQLVMAYQFLKALGVDGDIGTITLDLKGNRATATDGHEVLATSDGNVVVESSRYPFCFFGKPESEEGTTGVLEFLPFNEELNRFKLVVKGADAERLKVTWGDQSKTFSKEQLEKGINLAAEFLENPFCDRFRAVESMAKDQQSFEVALSRTVWDSLADVKKFLPEEKAAVESLERAAWQKALDKRERTGASVLPVRHTIRVEPTR